MEPKATKADDEILAGHLEPKALGGGLVHTPEATDINGVKPVERAYNYRKNILKGVINGEASQSTRVDESGSSRMPEVLFQPFPPPIQSISRPGSDMDSLVSQFGRTGIASGAPTSSYLFQVPKGYGRTTQITPETFYKQRQAEKEARKRKRDLGIVLPRTRKERHGYRPEELLWNGALELKDCKLPTLKNEVHPLFERDRFDGCPDYIYDQLLPALRLASILLTQPICMKFFVNLEFGNRQVDSEMSSRCGRLRHRIGDVTLTADNTAHVVENLKDLGHSELLTFVFIPTHKTLGGAFGWTQLKCGDHWSHFRRPLQKLANSRVILNGDFYTAMEQMSQLKYADAAQQLRAWFFLALNLCHEVAHAVEISKNAESFSMHSEPFFRQDNAAECGAAWESYTFGGRVQPINKRCDASHGISIWDWPERNSPVEPSSVVHFSVSMGYIENIFKAKTWDRDFDLRDWKMFHIPRDGAQSHALNSFTTMDWSEEVRIQQEFDDALDAIINEQPATKKRETGSGKAVRKLSDGTEVDDGRDLGEKSPVGQLPLPELPQQQPTTAVTVKAKQLGKKQRRWKARAEKIREKIRAEKRAERERRDEGDRKAVEAGKLELARRKILEAEEVRAEEEWKRENEEKIVAEVVRRREEERMRMEDGLKGLTDHEND